jgi:hypothetical protein
MFIGAGCASHRRFFNGFRKRTNSLPPRLTLFSCFAVGSQVSTPGRQIPAPIGLCALRCEKWARSPMCDTIREPRRHHPALSGKVSLIFIIVDLSIA